MENTMAIIRDKQAEPGGLDSHDDNVKEYFGKLMPTGGVLKQSMCEADHDIKTAGLVNRQLPVAPSTLSVRGADWNRFSERILRHVENYTVPQYGDAPHDEVESWTAADCVRAVKKYAARHGKNSRAGQDKLDLLKIAHFAQLAYDKITE
jgi:hypothetical protein